MGLQGKGMFITPLDIRELQFTPNTDDGDGKKAKGCKIEGFMNIPRISGSFWFTPHYANLLDLPDETPITANMSHTINHLMFQGEDEYGELISSLDNASQNKIMDQTEKRLDENIPYLNSSNYHFPSFADEEKITTQYLKNHFFALKDEEDGGSGPKRQVYFTNFVYDLTLMPIATEFVHMGIKPLVVYDYTFTSH